MVRSFSPARPPVSSRALAGLSRRAAGAWQALAGGGGGGGSGENIVTVTALGNASSGDSWRGLDFRPAADEVFVNPGVIVPVISTFTIGLWDVASKTLLAQTTEVTPDVIEDWSYFEWVEGPVSLTAGRTYFVGTHTTYPTTHNYYYYSDIDASPRAELLNGRYSGGGFSVFPSSNSGANAYYGCLALVFA